MLAVAAPNARAQGEEESNFAEAPRKFDEYGILGGCDHSARLDNFAIELMNNPQLVGYVVTYGPGGEGSGTGNFRLRVSKDYLLNSRGISEERIRTIYGGPYKNLDESATELWLAPKGAPAPVPVKYENKAGEFTGKFLDYETSDRLFVYDESMGPPIGFVGMANFAEMLRLQPKTRAFLVTYNGEESAPGAWRRVAARTAEDLRANYGIEAERIKIIFGGYDKEAKIQFWILPADAPPPVAEAREDRKLAKALQLGAFSQFELKYEDGAQQIFKALADVLRSDGSLKACVIIRPDVATTTAPEVNADEASDAAINEPAAPEEPPDIDLLQLVEKWKRDLEQDYGIGQDRIVVLVAPMQAEFSPAQLETWAIPPDAALPDPYAVEEVAEEFEDSEPAEENPPE